MKSQIGDETRQDKHAAEGGKGRQRSSSSDLALISIACNRFNSFPPTPILSLRQTPIGANRLFELLLGAELVGVAALLLALLVVSPVCAMTSHGGSIMKRTQLTALGGRRA